MAFENPIKRRGTRRRSEFPIPVIGLGRKCTIGLNPRAFDILGGGLGPEDFTVDLLWDADASMVGVRKSRDDDGVAVVQQSGGINSYRVYAYQFLRACGDEVLSVLGGRWPVQLVDGGILAICILDEPIRTGAGPISPGELARFERKRQARLAGLKASTT